MEHPMASRRYLMPSTEHRAPSTEHRAPSTEHRTPNTEQCLVEIYFADKQTPMCPVSNIGMAGLGMDSCPESPRSGMFLKIIVEAP